MKLIALTGQKGSGKDTFFKYLKTDEKNFGDKYIWFHNVKRFAIADIIKKEAIKRLNNNPLILQVYWVLDTKKLEDIKNDSFIRKYLQQLGDEIKKEKGEYYLIDQVLDQVMSHNWLAIITDIRLVQEAEYLEQWADETNIDYRLVRINSNKENTDSHRTEREVIDIEFHDEIFNNYTNSFLEQIANLLLKYDNELQDCREQYWIEEMDEDEEDYYFEEWSSDEYTKEELSTSQELLNLLNNQLFEVTGNNWLKRKKYMVYYVIVDEKLYYITFDLKDAEEKLQKLREEWAFKFDDIDFYWFIYCESNVVPLLQIDGVLTQIDNK